MSNVTAHLFDYNFHIGCDLFYPSGTLGLTFVIHQRLIQCITFSAEFFIDVVNKLHDSESNGPLVKFAKKNFY
jgi:hypothetical protein